MAVDFSAVFDSVGRLIFSFFSESEIFNIVELLSYKHYEICRCDHRWKDFVEKYILPGATRAILLREGNPNREETDSEKCENFDVAVVLGDRHAEIELQEGNTVPNFVLHDIVRSISPGYFAGGGHHENPRYWHVVTVFDSTDTVSDSTDAVSNSTNAVSDRMDDLENDRSDESLTSLTESMMVGHLSPFRTFSYCNGVWWYECTDNLTLRLSGKWGIFWRINFQADSSFTEARYKTDLKIRSVYNQIIFDGRSLSDDQQALIQTRRWVDLLVGIVDVRNFEPDSNEIQKDKEFEQLPFPINLEVGIVSKEKYKFGHLYDFLHCWPLKSTTPLKRRHEELAGLRGTRVAVVLNGETSELQDTFVQTNAKRKAREHIPPRRHLRRNPMPPRPEWARCGSVRRA